MGPGYARATTERTVRGGIPIIVFMRRFFKALFPALAGSTAGHAVHQMLARRSMSPEEREAEPLIFGSPMINAVIAALCGVVAGRRAAFWVGFGISAVAGTDLDRKVPALAGLHDRLLELGEEAAATPDEEGEEGEGETEPA
jgi:hypothetical protein